MLTQKGDVLFEEFNQSLAYKGMETAMLAVCKDPNQNISRSSLRTECCHRTVTV